MVNVLLHRQHYFLLMSQNIVSLVSYWFKARRWSGFVFSRQIPTLLRLLLSSTRSHTPNIFLLDSALLKKLSRKLVLKMLQSLPPPSAPQPSPPSKVEISISCFGTQCNSRRIEHLHNYHPYQPNLLRSMNIDHPASAHNVSRQCARPNLEFPILNLPFLSQSFSYQVHTLLLLERSPLARGPALKLGGKWDVRMGKRKQIYGTYLQPAGCSAVQCDAMRCNGCESTKMELNCFFFLVRTMAATARRWGGYLRQAVIELWNIVSFENLSFLFCTECAM